MSKWNKLIERICNLSKDLRFDELRKNRKQSLHIQKARLSTSYNTET